MSPRKKIDTLDKIRIGAIAGVRKAVLEHKKAGRSISVWRDGRVVRIPPERIQVS
jgi:hypothetical protein